MWSWNQDCQTKSINSRFFCFVTSPAIPVQIHNPIHVIWASRRIPPITHFSQAVLFRTTAFLQPLRPPNIPFPHSPPVQNNEFCFWCKLLRNRPYSNRNSDFAKGPMRCQFWILSWFDLTHCRNYFSVSYFSNYSKNILKIKSIQKFTNFVQNAGLFSFVFDKVFPNLWFATFAPCQNSWLSLRIRKNAPLRSDSVLSNTSISCGIRELRCGWCHSGRTGIGRPFTGRASFR